MRMFLFISVIAATLHLNNVAAVNNQSPTSLVALPSNSASAEPSCAAPSIDSTLRHELTEFETYELTPVSDADKDLWLYAASQNGHPESPPPGTILLIDDFIKPDLVRRSVYVTCDRTSYFFRDRGGVIDQYLWFGPITKIGKPALSVKEQDAH